MSTVEHLKIEEQGEVTVVYLREPRVTDPVEIEEIGKQLYQVLEFKNCAKVVVDFEDVEFLSSATIGKLISLNRKAKACKATLRFCNLRSELRDIFHLCSLDRLFEVHDSKAAAIASF